MIKTPQALAEKLGLMFRDPELLKTALTHRSMGKANNERLEYLGDSVLGFVIAQYLFETFPNASEGILSRLRANLVNQSSLAELARQYHLGDYLILGSGELKSGGYRRDSILSDALEAIMGALVRDQGIEVCQQWILSLFKKKLARLNADKWVKDPKTRLQELMQSNQLALPQYELLSQTGSAHEQTFTVRCSVQMIEESTVADGVSRKKAEQAAAEFMLELLQVDAES